MPPAREPLVEADPQRQRRQHGHEQRTPWQRCLAAGDAIAQHAARRLEDIDTRRPRGAGESLRRCQASDCSANSGCDPYACLRPSIPGHLVDSSCRLSVVAHRRCPQASGDSLHGQAKSINPSFPDSSVADEPAVPSALDLPAAGCYLCM